MLIRDVCITVQGVFQTPRRSRPFPRALLPHSCSGYSAALDLYLFGVARPAFPSFSDRRALFWRNPLHCRQNLKEIQCQTSVQLLVSCWSWVQGLQFLTELLPLCPRDSSYFSQVSKMNGNIDLIWLLWSLTFQSPLAVEGRRDLRKSGILRDRVLVPDSPTNISVALALMKNDLFFLLAMKLLWVIFFTLCIFSSRYLLPHLPLIT